MKKLSLFVLVFLFLFAIATAQDGKLEFGITGYYAMTQGNLTSQGPASDLYTGMWSPWFGQGFDGFFWGADPPARLDNVVGGDALAPENGPGMGIRVAYNVNDSIQFEATLDYNTKAFKIKDELATTVDSSYEKSMDLLDMAGRDPIGTKTAEYSKGKTYMAFFNVVYKLPAQNMTPYVKAGVGLVSYSEGPSFSYDITQHDGGDSAHYVLNVSYPSGKGIGFNFAAGVKIPFSENAGLALELRDVVVKYNLDQQVNTSFDYDGSRWILYDNYGPKVAVTQSGTLHHLMPSVSVFFLF